MNVEERILFERISSLSQLSDDERRIVEQDEQLMELIADNALLAAMAEVHALQPQRERMMASLDEAAQKEKQQMGIMKLFSGRSLRTQIAIGGAVALALLVVAQLMPGRDMLPGASPAWASSEGYTIVYDLEGLSHFSTSESGLNDAVDIWKAELGDREVKLATRISSDDSRTRVALSAGNVEEAQMDRLVELIAIHTGMLLDPQITGTTLFENGSYGPDDMVFGMGRGRSAAHDESLGRIAGLFVGETSPETCGAVVHGGGGEIILGSYSGLAQSADDNSVAVSGGSGRNRVAQIADGECRVIGVANLFGGRAMGVSGSGNGRGGSIAVATGGSAHGVSISSGGSAGTASFSGSGDGATVSGVASVGKDGSVASGVSVSSSPAPDGDVASAAGPQSDDFAAFWREVMENDRSTAVAGINTWTPAPDGKPGSTCWVSSDEEGSRWVVSAESAPLAWTPAPDDGSAPDSSFFETVPQPSRFVVMDDPQDSPFGVAPSGNGRSGVYFLQSADDDEALSFQVLERSRGNRELLPGYTIFGDTSGMRVFSFPAGSTAKQIQDKLDNWYEKQGRELSFKLAVDSPLTEELVLIVAEGVDSSQSLIILSGESSAGAGASPAPQPSPRSR